MSKGMEIGFFLVCTSSKNEKLEGLEKKNSLIEEDESTNKIKVRRIRKKNQQSAIVLLRPIVKKTASVILWYVCNQFLSMLCIPIS